MQRYSDGLKVPAQYTEYFAGETSNGSGKITLNLRYTPRSLNDIIVGVGLDVSSNRPRFYSKSTLVGKVFEIYAMKFRYYKSETTTGAAGAQCAGGGAGTHGTHTVGRAVTDLPSYAAASEAQQPIVVTYPISGT